MICSLLESLQMQRTGRGYKMLDAVYVNGYHSISLHRSYKLSYRSNCMSSCSCWNFLQDLTREVALGTSITSTWLVDVHSVQ